MATPDCILLLEDNPYDADLIRKRLEKSHLPLEVVSVDNGADFLHSLDTHTPDLILSDSRIPGYGGQAALQDAQARCPETPFVVFTGVLEPRQAMDFLDAGANDCLSKDELWRLPHVVRRELGRRGTKPASSHKPVVGTDSRSDAIPFSGNLGELGTSLFDCIPVAFALFDAAGRPAYVSLEFEKVLGWNLSSLQDAPWLEICFPVLPTRARMQSLLESRTGGWEKLRTRSREGRDRYLSWQVKSQSDGSKIAIAQDITEMAWEQNRIQQLNRHLEARIRRRNAEVWALEKELEAFAYSVSHDFKAPLRQLAGYAHLLKEQLGNELPEDASQNLQLLKNASRSVLKYLDNLLQYSRIGRVEMEMERVALGTLVEEVKFSAPSDPKDPNEPVIEWDIQQLPVVYGDRDLLKKVFEHLLSNAVKFSMPKKSGKVRIWSEETPHEWLTHIQDDGIGFDMKHSDHLFGIFQKLHPEGSFEGPGIGLALTRRIIGRHGGRIWAKAKIGQGAVFSFSLPKQ